MFTYTDSWTNLNSSLVEGLFFDKDNRKLLVRLEGGKQYIYPNVDRREVEAVAVSRSVGRAYNQFRAFRSRGNGGLRAHDEVVKPASVVATPSDKYTMVGKVSTYGASASSLSANYEVTFEVDGKAHTSTVQAPDLSAAVKDVQDKLSVFGTLRPVLTGVVRKS